MALESGSDTLLRSGDLEGARAALIETVKRQPTDQSARMFLWQLMVVSGEWDKALVQLRSLSQMSGEAQMLATVYNQAIAAEKTRIEAYAGRQPFSVLVASSGWIETLAQGLSALASGDAATGERLRDEAFDAAGDTLGVIDETSFTWIADADSRLGPCFEAIVAGRWGLVPFEAVSWIKTKGPEDLRDVVWLPVEMMLRSGQSAAALLPARYPGSEAGSAPVRLGRETLWDAGETGDQPAGQKLWTTDGGEDIGLLDFRQLAMA
jgi:type VI secretion system protein ImpE